MVAIWVAIARNNVPAADRVTEEIARRIEGLAAFPMMGAARDDLRKGIRQLSEPPYLIFYRVVEADATVEVIRVVHGARDLPDVL
jgi:toxin ParE1/3/4